MSILSAIRSAAIVVNRDFAVLEDNGFAQRAPRERRTFTISEGVPPRLTFNVPQHGDRVRRVMDDMIVSGQTALPEFVILPGRPSGFRIVLHIVPLWQPAIELQQATAEPQFILLWRRMSAVRQSNFAAMHREFGLSPAEMLIVEALGRGKTIEEFAEAKGISAVTARNQLRTASAKLGLTRQAEIAVLYAELSILWPMVDTLDGAGRVS